MISWYSSLFECLAALYFTMCLDKVLSEKIWTVDYYERFSIVLNEIDGKILISNKVISTLKGRVKEMQDGVTNLSVVMMAVIVGLLVLCGYETELDAKGSNMTSLHFAITVAMIILGVCATVLKRILFGNWKRATIVYISTVFAFCIILFLNLRGSVIEWVGDHCVISTVLALMLPVVIQIIYCWAYRNLYYGYMRSKVKALHDTENIDDKQFEAEVVSIAEEVNALILIASWVQHHLVGKNKSK